MNGASRCPGCLPRRLRSLHTLVLVLVLLLIGWLGWTWYRSSSFVKVDSVKVTGLSGPDVPQIRDALTAAALQMTTLNVDMREAGGLRLRVFLRARADGHEQRQHTPS